MLNPLITLAEARRIDASAQPSWPLLVPMLHATRCERSDLPTYSCAHCRPDVQARLADDPVYAEWLATEARMPWEAS